MFVHLSGRDTAWMQAQKQGHAHIHANALLRLKMFLALVLNPSCKIRNLGDNAQQELFAELGHRIRPASTTTKAMRKKFGLGRPHQIRQHNGRQRHCSRVSAFALLLPIKCLPEVNCAV